MAAVGPSSNVSLVTLQGVSYGFGGASLLEEVTLHIRKGERICLLGRNGEGKSTLMKLISGELAPDAGEVIRSKGIRIARLPQEVPQTMPGRVVDLVSGREAEAAGPAEIVIPPPHRVSAVLTQFELDPEALCQDLSAGLKRQVLLARALALEPDLLLLDEPTNHLDIAAICRLENELLRQRTALVLVTHDRAFLQRLSTAICEIDLGRALRWDCDYGTYLERKEASLQAEAAQSSRFDRKLSQEEAWIRQGVRARRTRNEGRVRKLEKMRETRKARRARQGAAVMTAQAAERSGNLVIEVEDLGFDYQDRMILREVSTTILRGDRVGIIGPNGAGKTTLLGLLLGRIAPSQGRVRHGTGLTILYFDQLREQLDEDKSVRENVADGNHFVEINGRRRHVIGYLKDFLFTPDRAESPVRILSGGERNRLLLAKLFTRASNVLVLDEPTNDLDAETLELLEEVLLDYAGTVLLVSHDRRFLNNVVTSTLVFEENGRIGEYVGGYDDWLRQRSTPDRSAPPKKQNAPPKPARPRSDSRPRKLTFKEERELDALPERIETLEAEHQALVDTLADPATYRGENQAIAKSKDRLETLEADLSAAYERWEQLEKIREAIEGRGKQ
jgi:ABC transport system ATP-binding/permease protein